MTDIAHTDNPKSATHSKKEFLTPANENQDQSDNGERDNSDGDGGERPVREKLKKTSIAALSQQAGEPIVTETTDAIHNDEATNSLEDSNTQRGRPARKRSFEDLQQEDIQPNQAVDNTTSPNRNSTHKRMRSRDVNSAENVPNTKSQPRTEDVIEEENHSGPPIAQTEDTNETEMSTQTNTTQKSRTEPNGDAILSPKKKRSRDQFDKDQSTKDNASEASSEHSAISGSDGPDISDSAPNANSKTVSGEPEKKRHRDESREAERVTNQQSTRVGRCSQPMS